MKKQILSIAIILMISLFTIGCKNNKEAKIEEAKTVETAVAETKYKAVNEQSKISWKADKIVGGHEGTINVSEGVFNFKGDQLVGGHVIFDIKSLAVTDIPVENEGNAKLVGHLLNADFFDADNHPNAAFEITNVEGANVSGNLTIKGIKKNVTFPANVTVANNTVTITSDAFTIDRTEFDIKYNSGKFADPAKLGDYLIKDDVIIKINVTAK